MANQFKAKRRIPVLLSYVYVQNSDYLIQLSTYSFKIVGAIKDAS